MDNILFGESLIVHGKSISSAFNFVDLWTNCGEKEDKKVHIVIVGQTNVPARLVQLDKMNVSALLIGQSISGNVLLSHYLCT